AKALVLDANSLRATAKLAVANRAAEPLLLEANLAEARHDALRALLKVEALEPGGPKPSDAYVAAAKQTAKAQRRGALLEAERPLSLARQGEQSAREPKRAPFTKQRQAAEQALAKAAALARSPETTAYAPRPIKTYPTTSTGRRSAFARWIANRDNPLAARIAVNHVWLRHFGQA